MPRALGSTSARLAVLLFAAIFIPTLAMLAFMQLISARALGDEERALVREMREELLADYDSAGARGLAASIQQRVELDPSSETVLAVVARDGRITAGNMTRLPSPLPRSGWFERRLPRAGHDAPELVRFEVTSLPDSSRLVAGHFQSSADALRRANARGLLMAALLAAPLALGLTFMLLRLVERRVSRIAHIAGQVGSGDLSRRVASDASGDAFDRLGQALNTMLERIETLVGELRLVTDGLAHDLRSPITRLQAALEQARAASGPGRLAALDAARAEAVGLHALLATALQITRAEAGIGRDRFRPVPVKAVLGDVAEIYGPLAEEQGFTIAVAAPEGLEVLGHRELIGQALGNLVENALHYAAGGSAIRLAGRRAGKTVVLEIADNGVGIPAERRGEALSRFGRLDPARHIAGSGLGLALVTATARLHGGTVALADARPGLLVRITLPAD
ncbi:MAG: HAMP domain-containing sensor histidine kinase [Croceibacterium sp.]